MPVADEGEGNSSIQILQLHFAPQAKAAPFSLILRALSLL